MRVIPIVLLIGAPLAGCLAADDADPDASDRVGAAGLHGPPPAAYYSLEVEATPEGSVSAYSWRIPRASYIASPTPGQGQDLAFEIAPRMLRDGAPPLTEWTLLLFELTGNGTTHTDTIGESTLTIVSRDLEGTSVSETGPMLRPWWVVFSPRASVEGDEIGIVLVARAPQPEPFEVGFRILTTHPFLSGYRVSRDFEEFVAQAGSHPVQQLRPLATVSGYEYALYGDFNFGTTGVEVLTPYVEVTHAPTLDLRPAAAVRGVTLTLDFEADEGWTEGLATYVAQTAAGTWSVDGDAHGTPVSGHSLVAAPLTGSPQGVLGAPYYEVRAEGAGGSHFEFELQLVEGGTVEVLIIEQLELPVTMQALFGEGGSAFVLVPTGPLGNIPPGTLDLDDHGWTLTLPGARDVHIGNAPAWPS